MILGILGSAAKDSVTREVLLRAGERVERSGGRFDVVDLAVEFPRAHALEDYDDPPPGSQNRAAARPGPPARTAPCSPRPSTTAPSARC
ncbi:hypothetical protein GCM10023238_36650 [Streptomyces heliomycini]